MPSSGAKTLLTSPEVSRLLKKSLRTIHRLAVAGDLEPAQKLPGPNGAFLFDPDVVDRFVQEQKADPAA